MTGMAVNDLDFGNSKVYVNNLKETGTANS
jgi:hypothetical protein